jgi:hypothetical protein
MLRMRRRGIGLLREKPVRTELSIIRITIERGRSHDEEQLEYAPHVGGGRCTMPNQKSSIPLTTLLNSARSTGLLM